MKVLVTGASGQLGYDVCEELKHRGYDYRGVSSKDFDLTQEDEIISYLMQYRPDCVIHCAAYTAVDQAEDEADKCRIINAEATKIIAEYCKKINAKMLYISTDYVFDGTGDNFFETNDPTGPLNVYGATKLEGEQFVREILPEHFIVRISWVFGLNGKNFVKTMLKLGKSNQHLRITGDQFGSPTYTKDLAPLLCDMIETDRFGTYHATNEGVCTWAEFASEIFKLAEMPVKVTPRKASEYPSKAVRPHNSRMSKKCLQQAGFDRLPDWKDALKRYLNQLKESKVEY